MIDEAVVAPPEDPAAERALLGAILLGRGDAFVIARSLLSSEDFTREIHRVVFGAMERLHLRGETIDTTSIASEIPRASLNESPLGYLAGLMADVPSLGVETHARRVRFCATLRRIASAANELAGVAYGPWASTEADAMARVQGVVDGLFTGQIGTSVILTPKALTTMYMDVLEGRQQKDPAYIGIPTGFSDLDRVVAYRPGELWFVAASPGVGKTTLLANLQDELAMRKIPSLFASAEQPAVQLMDRTMASDTRIDSWKIARGDLDEDQWARMSSHLARRFEMPSYIYDDPSMTTSRLSAITQLATVRYGVKVVFVDYVQLLADESGESEYARISAISRRLALLARSLKICVVAACQVSRQGAHEDGQIPSLAHLRGSGSLEQDAFVVLAVGRKAGTSEAQIIVRKNRNGESEVTVPLYFDAEHTRFRSLSR